MKEKTLKNISYIYLILPIIIFFIGFLKIQYALILTLLLSIAFFVLVKNCKQEDNIFISKKKILGIYFAVLLICIVGGHGGLFYQTKDWQYRNAIFRDLILSKWPIYYNNSNTALTYYICQWMVPSVFGKLYLYKINYDYDAAFAFGNFFLLIWNSIGVTLAVLWMIKVLNLKSKKNVIIGCLIFMFFSGLDIVEMFTFGTEADCIKRFHLEWSSTLFQYSSMITQLYWVFNQCIVPWIITVMFMDEKRVNNYMILILLMLPYAPLPFAGSIILLGIKGITILIDYIKNHKIKEFIKDVFSIQNILGFISILPIFGIYYFGNAIGSGEDSSTGFRFDTGLLNVVSIIILVVFWFWEIGIYVILLNKKYKKDPIFYAIPIFLIILPFFKVGNSIDLMMRSSIPWLIVLNLYTIKYIVEGNNFNAETYLTRKVLLIMVLGIGLITPLTEITRSFYFVCKEEKISIPYDDIGSLNSFTTTKEISNFVTINPKDSSLFYKYFAKY